MWESVKRAAGAARKKAVATARYALDAVEKGPIRRAFQRATPKDKVGIREQDAKSAALNLGVALQDVAPETFAVAPPSEDHAVPYYTGYVPENIQTGDRDINSAMYHLQADGHKMDSVNKQVLTNANDIASGANSEQAAILGLMTGRNGMIEKAGSTIQAISWEEAQRRLNANAIWYKSTKADLRTRVKANLKFLADRRDMLLARSRSKTAAAVSLIQRTAAEDRKRVVYRGVENENVARHIAAAQSSQVALQAAQEAAAIQQDEALGNLKLQKERIRAEANAKVAQANLEASNQISRAEAEAAVGFVQPPNLASDSTD
eukprot:gnl/TRDRNA2_/TRDRNA2_41004_c0_seq1.p1 gnl/TRDRNA2_/TRDRNA2_41004_c0~~gnl/TRDRNA2_/TRDRNA2_41004_c0_seq1.p1  ORF type:complete len:319 (+),score=55.01 gnl/TRDRNA2_/TRDRNA2_41004_c0_seq1:1-957(+)